MNKIILLFALFAISVSFFAQQSTIKELEKQRKQTLLEISNTDKLLRETKKNSSTLLNRIKLVSNQIASRKKVVSLLESEVKGLDAEQLRIEGEIVILQSELKDKQSSYGKAVEAALRNRQNENKLLFILSGQSMSESYRRLRYLRNYSEWRSTQAEEIKDKSEELKTKKNLLIKTRSEKQVLLKQRGIEQENLKKEEINYQSEVKGVQAKQKELQKELTQKKRKADALNKQIEKLIAEEVARQEREAKRREAERAKSGTTSPNKGVSTITSEDVKLSGSFAANKGKLPYPVTGNHSIITRFGTHKHQQWREVTTTSSGIDIQAQSGAQARAVFDGEVSRVVAFPGYNNCVIIRHGNYYTFYGNIQTLSVKKGDKVKINQSLGRIYTDPDTGTSELHFQLWQGTTKLNPESWLR